MDTKRIRNAFQPFNGYPLVYVFPNQVTYYSLLSAIPQSWNKILRVNSGESTTPPPPIGTITCKMYDKLLTFLLLLQKRNSHHMASQKRI